MIVRGGVFFLYLFDFFIFILIKFVNRFRTTKISSNGFSPFWDQTFQLKFMMPEVFFFFFFRSLLLNDD